MHMAQGALGFYRAEKGTLGMEDSICSLSVMNTNGGWHGSLPIRSYLDSDSLTTVKSTFYHLECLAHLGFLGHQPFKKRHSCYVAHTSLLN